MQIRFLIFQKTFFILSKKLKRTNEEKKNLNMVIPLGGFFYEYLDLGLQD